MQSAFLLESGLESEQFVACLFHFVVADLFGVLFEFFELDGHFFVLVVDLFILFVEFVVFRLVLQRACLVAFLEGSDSRVVLFELFYFEFEGLLFVDHLTLFEFLFLFLQFQFLLHEGFLVVQVFVDFSRDGLPCETVEMLGEFVEELPLLNGVSVARLLVVDLFDLFEVLDEFAELLVLVCVYFLLDGFCYLLGLLSVLLLPDVAILSDQICHTLLESLLEFLEQVRVTLLRSQRALLELGEHLFSQLRLDS